MTQAFHDFLVWFDGWSENIDEAPNAKQWERLRAKVTEVRTAAPAAAVARPVAVPEMEHEEQPERARPVKAVKQVNPVIAWKAKFKGELIRVGYDPESADEMMPTAIDTTSDPIALARSAAVASGAVMN